MRLWCADRIGVRVGGAPAQAGRWRRWRAFRGGEGHPLGRGPHSPAATAAQPLAPCGLFEAETTRGRAEAGCYPEKVGEG